MALLTEKLLFIHVPKTGGSSVRAMIAAAGVTCWESGQYAIEDHYGLPELRAAHPRIEDGLLSFGFVRDPVAWLQSRWAWALVTEFSYKVQTRPDAAAHWMALCWSNTFEEFAERYLERCAGTYTRTVFGMLGLWMGKPVNRIGRTEHLTLDLLRFLEEAGEPHDRVRLLACAREKVAASGGLAARCVAPPDLRRRLLEAERPLCERFGYGG